MSAPNPGLGKPEDLPRQDADELPPDTVPAPPPKDCEQLTAGLVSERAAARDTLPSPPSHRKRSGTFPVRLHQGSTVPAASGDDVASVRIPPLRVPNFKAR